MAKEPAKKSASSGKGEPAPPPAAVKPGRSNLKVAIAVVVILLLEVGTVVVTMMLTGGPKSVEGHSTLTDQQAEQARPVELMVIKDQFPNQRTGRVYLYDTEIWITVQKRESERVKAQVQNMQATIATDLAVIFRRAEPAHLTEPTLATLNRQIKAALDERVGRDAEGRPILQEVLIKKCTQFRADG